MLIHYPITLTFRIKAIIMIDEAKMFVVSFVSHGFLNLLERDEHFNQDCVFSVQLLLSAAWSFYLGFRIGRLPILTSSCALLYCIFQISWTGSKQRMNLGFVITSGVVILNWLASLVAEAFPDSVKYVSDVATGFLTNAANYVLLRVYWIIHASVANLRRN